ncbi:MAG TPA: EF-hand domain-containing protein [Gammaproteobacteria bacterium]
MKAWTVVALAAALGTAALTASAQPPGPPSFDQIDADKSGALSEDEVRQFFTRMFQNMPRGPGAGGPGAGGPGAGGPGAGGPPIDGNLFGQLFQTWDANKDGSVSREEFDNRPRMQGPGGGAGPGGRGPGGRAN